MLETTPRVTMMAVMVRGGATRTILRTRASIRPDLSATPMPIIATRMIPTGPKFMKFATTEVEIKRIPSADNRPWTFIVTSATSWVCGLIRRYVALTPSHCSTCESKIKIAIRRENNTAGCGTAFPTRSTASRARFISVLVAPLDPLMIRASRLRPRDEQVHPGLLRQERGHELPLDAVPGGVQRRGEGAQSSLARRYGDDPAADPALARQPDVEEPVARGLVEAGRRHHGQRVVADRSVHHALLGDRIHP